VKGAQDVAGTSSDFLAGGGELGALMRAKDWAATPLGPVQAWPQSLRTAVSILLNSRYPMFIFWGPQHIKIYNDGYRPITGDKHPWALGRPGTQVWPEIWSDIGPMVERVVRDGEATWSDDLRLFMHRRGFPEEVFFTFSYSPIRDESGGIGGMFCACTETTVKVQGERRLKLLRDLAAAPSEARSVADACRLSADVLAGNPQDIPFALVYLFEEGGPRLVAQAGVREGDAPGAWPLESRALVEDLAARFRRVPAGPWPEPPSRAMVLPLVDRALERPCGALVLGISSRTLFDDAYRDFFGLVASQLATSIANARAAEEERRRVEALSQLDRAKTAFFSNVSHEFRTPLTLMLGPLEDALADAEAPLAAAQRERLELVRRSALRLQKLVNSLLEFSRIEAGRAQASYEPTDLAAETADLASSFRSACQRAGLRLEVDCPALPEPVYVDRDMWEKVVLNLLSNAFKFTFEGAIAVALRRAGDAVELSVRDTGTGIPAAELPKVFERFRRVEGARSRTHEGSGIGLALVQELVRLHGGTVSAESVEGRGSTFTVRIPLGSAHLPAERIGAARALASTAIGAESFVEEALRWLPQSSRKAVGAASPVVSAAPASARARILWADDNADMRDYVARLLATRYDVEAVADGEAALAAARARRPELLLADVMMPGLDGLQLVRALRADPALRSIPVILLSARAGEEARIEGFDAGANDYLYKPFSARELLARVSARLELDALHARLEEERLRLARLYAQTPIPTAVLRGSDLVFEMVNPAYAAIAGRRELEGKPLLEAMPEMRGQGFDALMREVMRTGEPHIGHEARVRLHRNRRVEDAYFNYIYAPLRDAAGAVDRVLAVLVEVTEQVNARHRLEESDRRKDDFLATLSHELRNPLAPISNAVRLLRDAGSDPQIAEQARAILERQVAHTVRLVDDLLDVTRIAVGKLALEKHRVDTKSLLQEAIERSRPLIEAAGHTLEVRAPQDAVPLVADPVRLSQVLSNLLNNAAKYTPAGGRIVLSLEQRPGAVVITVADNGAGIPASMLERVFERFAQVDAHLNRVHGGLGIGLALSRQLVELHGGTIVARSAGLGRGSEFIVRLPTAEAPAAATRAA
jgi:signal transduction histidine kinase